MITGYSCHLCGENELSGIAGYSELPRVTSDCKPWPSGGDLVSCAACGAIQKLTTPVWHDEVSRIYGAYQIYHLANGAEQPIFAADGSARPRSQVLIEYVLSAASFGETGRMIDIGCGNGDALANFAVALPGWRLNGSELSDKALPFLRRLANFDTLYTVLPKDIPDRFDFITMIHSLEHVPAARETLQVLGRMLTRNGRIFIEVPNAEISPFDILVADHLIHLTPNHLRYVAALARLKPLEIRSDVMPKEISMLAIAGEAAVRRPDPRAGRVLATATVAWLKDTIGVAREAASSARAAGRQFGIFGTSISGMWLYGVLRDAVAFFVDEDAQRAGVTQDGRPIVAPPNAPVDSIVFMPLAPATAARIAVRLRGGPARYVLPPAMPSTAL